MPPSVTTALILADQGDPQVGPHHLTLSVVEDATVKNILHENAIEVQALIAALDEHKEPAAEEGFPYLERYSTSLSPEAIVKLMQCHSFAINMTELAKRDQLGATVGRVSRRISC